MVDRVRERDHGHRSVPGRPDLDGPDGHGMGSATSTPRPHTLFIGIWIRESALDEPRRGRLPGGDHAARPARARACGPTRRSPPRPAAAEASSPTRARLPTSVTETTSASSRLSAEPCTARPGRLERDLPRVDGDRRPRPRRDSVLTTSPPPSRATAVAPVVAGGRVAEQHRGARRSRRRTRRPVWR